MPRSRGGQHTWDNIVSACKPCNHGKAGRTPKEAGLRLFTVPREPRPTPYAMFHWHGVTGAGWRRLVLSGSHRCRFECLIAKSDRRKLQHHHL
jgi:hypothetical protein